ncbi:MAG: septum formation protein Maf, partial [Fusobacteriaceae bacterium]|nr:septum formation protein Maf [Fusobacteriaceae bacterium]
ILAADTVVVLNGKIFGKPQGEDEAKEMLKLLSNETHEVITAYCLINFQKKIEIISHNITKVKFKNLDEELINWYISTKEPLDKAGAYGIQGKGAILIEKIEGDFFSVMGLPIGKIVSDLLGTGLKLEDLNKI